MSRKKIREYDAKKILHQQLKTEYQAVLVNQTTNLETIPQEHPFLSQKLVVKPDQLFGKRKKHNLVLINANYEEVKQFIQEHMNKEVTIGKATDRLTHFLIEPFVEHQQEYYLAFKSEREHDLIYFSEEGGIEIEENWEQVKTLEVPTLIDIYDLEITFTNNEIIKKFIKEIYQVFLNFDFTYLEINPFTIKDNQIHLLDTVAHLDSCAAKLHFPPEFGKKQFPEEKLIQTLDQNSGASLKLTILNPQGKIWNILGGGGASIIYLDMIANLNQGNQIANYGEASGNPTTVESYLYAKAILELMIKNNGKILFIVGGIANFTNIKNSFTGIIKALEEYADKLQHITIFIRRGGPQEEAGLALIKQTGTQLGLKMHVHGPETSMPEIIKIAQEYL
ncbi:MAG: ATPase [Nanoarchaeota archaeon]|nr:ATPase [Nanoarchaeota archaeon]